MIAKKFFNALWYEFHKEIFKQMGWAGQKPKGSRGSDFDATAEIEKLTGRELSRFLMRLALVQELTPPMKWYDRGRPDELALAAKRYGVHMDKIAATVQNERAEKRKEAAKRDRRQKAKGAKAVKTVHPIKKAYV